MKKSQLKTYTEYFGGRLQVGKIADKETRMEMVMLFASLHKAYKPVADEIEDVRKSLVEGHESEIAKYASLLNYDSSLSEEENAKRREEAASMSECVRIESDFKEASDKILAEEVDSKVRKVSLATMYEALMACGFPGLPEDAPLGIVSEMFEELIKD